jgi:hypothetical protein
MDWEKAEKHLNLMRKLYTDIGSSGMPALLLSIRPLLVRFKKGERTEDLFNKIMELC